MSRRPAQFTAVAGAMFVLALLGPAATAGADPVQAGAAPTAPTTVGPDLGITISGQFHLLGRGRLNPVGFTVTGGPSADATVALTVPAGFAVSGARIEGADAICAQDGQQVTCDLGAISAHPSLLTVAMTPPTSTPLGPVSITATVSGVEGADPDPGNDSATRQYQVIATSHLETAVTPSALTVVGAASAPLHIAVSNSGPDAATNVVVVVRAEGDTTLGAVTGAGAGTADGDARTVRITLASVAPGSTAGIDVRVAAILPGTGSDERSVTVAVSGDVDPGTCTLNEACELVTPVTVIPGAAGEPPVGTEPTTAARPQLANTGDRDLAAGATGLALVVAGAGLTLLGRRRRA